MNLLNNLWLEKYINIIIFFDFCYKLFYKFKKIYFLFFVSLVFFFKGFLDFDILFSFSKLFYNFRNNIFNNNIKYFFSKKRYSMRKRKIRFFFNIGYFFSLGFDFYFFFNYYFFSIISLMLYYKQIFLLNIMNLGFIIKWHDIYTRHDDLTKEFSIEGSNNIDFLFNYDVKKIPYVFHIFFDKLYSYLFFLFFSYLLFLFLDKRTLKKSLYSRFFFFINLL